MSKNWEIKKLGEVCDFYNGQAHEKYIDEKGKYIVINSKFISSDATSFKRTNEALFLLHAGDIVMVMSDVPNGKAIAKCFLIDKNDTYTLNQRICAIRTGSFDLKFLLYQLNRHEYLLEFDNGENQTNLRKDDILDCPLLIPPLPVQQQIVAFLDEAFAFVAKAKANAEQNLKNAKELFVSYLQRVFKYKSDGWEEKKLGDICELIMGQSPPGESYNSSNKGVPLINGPVEFGKEPFSKTIKSKFTTEPTKHCKENDLILCVRGSTTGRINIAGFDACIGRGVAAVRYSKNQTWLNYYFLASRQKIFDLGTGATFPNVSADILKNLFIPLPPFYIQQSIIHTLDELSSKTKKMESIYQQKLNDLEELKKSIIQKAFNGELRLS